MSLDDDPRPEQIVAFRPAGSADGQIHIGVIDYAADEVSWKMIREAVTQAQSPNTLQISLINLVTDSAPEILVRGTAGYRPSDARRLPTHPCCRRDSGHLSEDRSNRHAKTT